MVRATGAATAATAAALPGIVKTCPMRMNARASSAFAVLIAATDVCSRAAIAETVSPRATV